MYHSLAIFFPLWFLSMIQNLQIYLIGAWTIFTSLTLYCGCRRSKPRRSDNIYLLKYILSIWVLCNFFQWHITIIICTEVVKNFVAWGETTVSRIHTPTVDSSNNEVLFYCFYRFKTIHLLLFHIIVMIEYFDCSSAIL